MYEPIPEAPIAPRLSPTALGTGAELIIWCGYAPGVGEHLETGDVTATLIDGLVDPTAILVVP